MTRNLIKLYVFLGFLTFLWGCFPTKSISFLASTQDAEVDMKHISQVEILNRTQPSNSNFLGNVLNNGNLTYEDRPGVEAALNALKNNLKTKKYFSSVYSITKRVKSEQSKSLPPALSVDEILEITRSEGALISLETFYVDEKESFKQEQKHQLDPQGNDYYITITRGTKELNAYCGWRVYEISSGKILDEYLTEHTHSFEVEGIDKANARQKLDTNTNIAYKELGNVLGSMYANRISPTATYVNRIVYIKGAIELEEGKEYIKLKDWETAKAVWDEGLKSQSENKVLARLYHNIGVYYEQKGDVDNAILNVELAKELGAISGSYLTELKTIKQRGY